VARHSSAEKGAPKLTSIALWPSSFIPRGDLHIEIVPALLPVLSKEHITESSLHARYLEPRVSVCLFTSYQVEFHRCITYIYHWLAPSASYNPTQASRVSRYANDVHDLVLVMTMLSPDRGRTSPSICGAANISTYSNRILLSGARLGYRMIRPHQPSKYAEEVMSD
jgi:hypothetical protein